MPDYKQFPLADTAEGLTEAEILGWRVQPGDEVQVNQIVVEVETAKAAVELPIPWAGVVTELLVEPGQTVEVGTPILTVDVDPQGAAPATPASNGAAQPAQAEEEMKPLVGYGSKTVVAKRRARTGGGGTPAPEPVAATAPPAEVPTPRGGYVPLAKPPVRKLAKELGVDLRELDGTADGGVITRDDVQRAAAAEPEAPGQQGSRERRVPIKGVRKATAQAMVASAFTAPHVTEFLTIDVTPMMELRQKLKVSPAFAGVKLTPLAFAAKAACLAMRRTPDINALWDGDNGEIVYKDYVHLGIAAATPRGLVVPKIRDAESMSLVELAGALEALTSTAREGKTPPADMLGGTFTITNVGVFGVDTGTPIINPGESAILAVGAIRDMPWVVEGELAVRKVMQLSLSFDHRVIDGQQGSEYLANVGALLSDPAVAMTY
ncbi:branched-chain alpha-keto acid dehydrogenase subunit E2 [Prauserella marina]|uniref:Dihydrolipoamide acetyltransferase component of pyruvate dehydrogenase complex n=1 Tax=Prauserella marina TaxID=530584 RepID=A0A222VXS2_9PSEU|nr:dihydrolipoamide acetyltransferase family protein [Prauserella marina]ASR38727.1 branched-chain alpha-keto acid dehydrogenase subunit E2 [Prauserella marina]PWV82074.1 pyruvate dehydrogenase E2 component (dihydrolipoamide acetyltransferase) [Prauserella marina]SDD18841.1 pyruvate dehydrogenase E2 component (dihydrolipoamide acetyltransferase) [Prauserella marina]